MIRRRHAVPRACAPGYYYSRATLGSRPARRVARSKQLRKTCGTLSNITMAGATKSIKKSVFYIGGRFTRRGEALGRARITR